METTNSESSGRNTRYWPPAEEVTVNPSSRPISSSCSKWPRLEKKRLPGSRQMLCRRPLVSTSRTHSPPRSGPRWTPDQACGGTSGACSSATLPNLAERAVDVGGGEHAVDVAVVLQQ